MSSLGTRGAAVSHAAFERMALGLPQPLHLFAYLTRGHHYHFGEFANADDTLANALDRRAISCGRLLPMGDVLDVGCGLGGASWHLAKSGRRTLGLDPCAEAIAFAVATLPRVDGLRFVAAPLGTPDAYPRASFDGVLFLEALQFFPALSALFRHLRELIRDGGALVFSDVFSNVDRPWSSVPYHRLGHLEVAAREAGFEPSDVPTPEAHPVRTLDLLLEALEARRPELLEVFRPHRPKIDAEVEELDQQCGHLRRAFLAGDLTHQTRVYVC